MIPLRETVHKRVRVKMDLALFPGRGFCYTEKGTKRFPLQ